MTSSPVNGTGRACNTEPHTAPHPPHPHPEVMAWTGDARLSHAPTRAEIQPRSAAAPTPAGPRAVSRSRGIASKYGAGSDAAPGPGGGTELRGRVKAPFRGPTAALPRRYRGRPAGAGNRMRPRSSRTERPRGGGRAGVGRASLRTAPPHAGSPSGAPPPRPAAAAPTPPHAARCRAAIRTVSPPPIHARRRPAVAGPRRPLPVPYLSAAEQRAGARRGCAAARRHRPLPAPPPPAAHAPSAARHDAAAGRSGSDRPGPRACAALRRARSPPTPARAPGPRRTDPPPPPRPRALAAHVPWANGSPRFPRHVGAGPGAAGGASRGGCRAAVTAPRGGGRGGAEAAAGFGARGSGGAEERRSGPFRPGAPRRPLRSLERLRCAPSSVCGPPVLSPRAARAPRPGPPPVLPAPPRPGFPALRSHPSWLLPAGAGRFLAPMAGLEPLAALPDGDLLDFLLNDDAPAAGSPAGDSPPLGDWMLPELEVGRGGAAAECWWEGWLLFSWRFFSAASGQGDGQLHQLPAEPL